MDSIPVLPMLPFSAKDSDKIVWILTIIKNTLKYLVEFDDPPALDFATTSRFRGQWEAVEKALDAAIEEAPGQFSNSIPKKLVNSGMTSEMLTLKTATVAECVDGLYREVRTKSPILSLKWPRPALKCFNSIMSSLLGTFPGLEMVKEFKDHFEVSLDIAEIKQAK